MAASVNVAISLSSGSGVANTLTLTNKSGAAIPNYELSFNRVHMPGEIPNFGQLVVGGSALTTQCNVTARWPDGSVKVAMYACVVPSLPATGSLSISFQNQASGNTTALTAAQMLATPFDFDCVISAVASQIQTLKGAAVTNGPSVWQTVTNGGYTITVNGVQHVVTGLNFSAASTWAAIQSIVQGSLPAGMVQWPGDGYVRVVGTTVGFSTPPATGTDIGALGFLGWSASAGGTITTTGGGSPQTVSARTMLSAGKYRVIYGGGICQTIMLGDDSATRTYDMGFGDGHKPVRPRFYADFWAGSNRVRVRAVMESGLIDQLEDASYTATVSTGFASPTQIYSLDLATGAKHHWAMTTWSKIAWINGTPIAQVNLDHNLAYLTRTRALPNYDPAKTMDENSILNMYGWFTSRPNDNYDGLDFNNGSMLSNSISKTGGRPEIGPYICWEVAWLYTGDWRMKRQSLGSADIAGAFPAHMRETGTTARMSRYDAANSGTGLGHCLANTDHPWFAVWSPDNIAATAPAVGPIDSHQPFSFDGAHQWSRGYIPYLLTGDPHYLQEMYQWNAFAAMRYTGGTGGTASARGPTGKEGGIADETRGCGWVLRNRAECAWIAPDADPEKAYFTYLVNDAIARWEGNTGFTGNYSAAPALPGYSTNMWQWGVSTGNHQSGNLVAGSLWEGTISPLRNWDSDGEGGPSPLFGSDVLDDGSPWMNNYFTYGLVRCKELGWAAGPMVTFNSGFNMGITLDSPDPRMNCLYRMALVSRATNNWYMTWQQSYNAMLPGYIAGTDNQAFVGGFPAYFLSQGSSESYMAAAKAIAAMLHDEARGDLNWNWHVANEPSPGIQSFGGSTTLVDPRWCILPRTDGIVLPAIPIT